MLKLFKKLPIELQSKILYKSGMKEPCAEIMRYLIDEENKWRQRRWDIVKNRVEDVDFIQHLRDRKVLKQVGISIEALVDMILLIHFEDEQLMESDSSDEDY